VSRQSGEQERCAQLGGWWPVLHDNEQVPLAGTYRHPPARGYMYISRYAAHMLSMWCRHQTQTRDHLFKECTEWKPQQKILWAEVKKETGRWKDRWKVRDLLGDGRCSQAVLDFLATTDVGRRAPAEEDDAVSAVSELEVREWMEEQGAGAEEPDGEGPPLILPTPDFMASAGMA